MAKRRVGFGIVALLAILLSTWITVAAGWAGSIDRTILADAHGVAASAMVAITRFGDTVSRFVLAGVIAVALMAKLDRGGAAFLLVSVFGGAGFNSLLKNVFARPRPDLLPHLDVVQSSSFPSGHSAGALVLGFALALVAVRHGVSRAIAYTLAGLLALLVGVSRVVLAVHWPSDVLAGWSAGGLWLIGCAAAFAWITGAPVGQRVASANSATSDV